MDWVASGRPAVDDRRDLSNHALELHGFIPEKKGRFRPGTRIPIRLPSGPIAVASKLHLPVLRS
jgi:hypothetical protein